VWLSRPEADEEAAHWLIWARNTRTGEEKYFVSNASAQTPLATLLRVAFRRWPIEHGFRVSKSEIGFRHFEGRSYVALMRHLVLCLLTLTFVAGQAERLRGEKPRGNGGASVPGSELGVRGMAGAAAGNESPAVHVASHCVPPAA
jgi:SRSO17 transposase